MESTLMHIYIENSLVYLYPIKRLIRFDNDFA